MDLQTIKLFHSACYLAKRIVEFKPNLPEDLTLKKVYALEAIHSIEEKKGKRGKVLAIDVARHLGISKQNATRWLKELYKDELIFKQISKDERHIFLGLTEKGKKYYTDYITSFEKNMVKLFGSVSKNDMQVCASTIHQAFYLLASKYPDLLGESQQAS